MSQWQDDRDARRLGNWMVSQAKSTWRKGKCLWDWDRIEAETKAAAAMKAATAARKKAKSKTNG